MAILFETLQFKDDSGNVLSSGKIYTYVTGTTTPAVTYRDNTENTSHTMPILLDLSGKPPGQEIWLDSSTIYTIKICDRFNNVIQTIDNVKPSFGVSSSSITLGGNLDLNGNSIISPTSTNINITSGVGNQVISRNLSPLDNCALSSGNLKLSNTSKILDKNSSELITLTRVASALNNLNISNSSTGNPISLEIQGTDTNISLDITPKGTGNTNAVGNLTVVGDIDSPTLNVAPESGNATMSVTSLDTTQISKILIQANKAGLNYNPASLSISGTNTNPPKLKITNGDNLGNSYTLTVGGPSNLSTDTAMLFRNLTNPTYNYYMEGAALHCNEFASSYLELTNVATIDISYNSNKGINIPQGTTAEATSTAGSIRFNTDEGSLEYTDNNLTRQLSKIKYTEELAIKYISPTQRVPFPGHLLDNYDVEVQFYIRLYSTGTWVISYYMGFADDLDVSITADPYWSNNTSAWASSSRILAHTTTLGSAYAPFKVLFKKRNGVISYHCRGFNPLYGGMPAEENRGTLPNVSNLRYLSLFFQGIPNFTYAAVVPQVTSYLIKK